MCARTQTNRDPTYMYTRVYGMHMTVRHEIQQFNMATLWSCVTNLTLIQNLKSFLDPRKYEKLPNRTTLAWAIEFCWARES